MRRHSSVAVTEDTIKIPIVSPGPVFDNDFPFDEFCFDVEVDEPEEVGEEKFVFVEDLFFELLLEVEDLLDGVLFGSAALFLVFTLAPAG